MLYLPSKYPVWSLPPRRDRSKSIEVNDVNETPEHIQ
jgi:hypothetical protein